MPTIMYVSLENKPNQKKKKSNFLHHLPLTYYCSLTSPILLPGLLIHHVQIDLYLTNYAHTTGSRINQTSTEKTPFFPIRLSQQPFP